jgi:hypothetical protein
MRSVQLALCRTTAVPFWVWLRITRRSSGRPSAAAQLYVRRHMYSCPSCNAQSIGYFRKWLSYPTLPAHCKACGSYSYAQRSSGGVGLVVAAVVITASGFAAAALHSSWPLLVGVSAAVAFYLRHWHQVKLEPLLPEQVALARRTEGLGLVALLLATLSN